MATITFDQAVRERLEGSVPAPVYPGEAPPDAEAPYCVQEELSQEEAQTIQGAVYLDTWLLSVECVAATRCEARQVARAVTDRLRGWKGDAGGGITVKRVTLEDESSEALPPAEGEAQGSHSVTLDFRCHFSG